MRFKLLTLIFVCVLLVGSVSAFEFDNVKSYDLEKNEITIKNAFGLGEDIATYSLKENSDICLMDCYAEGDAYLYKKGFLFTDVQFKDIHGDYKDIIENKFYIEQEEEVSYMVTQYKEVCETLINGSNGCYEKPNGQKQVKKVIKYWEEYAGEELPAGNYRWRLEGKKNKLESVDWIVSAFGEDLTEWEWWSSGYNFKKELTGLNETIPLSLNGSLYLSLAGADTLSYGVCEGIGCAIYYNDSTISTIANDTDEFWKVTTRMGGVNNLTKYNVTGTTPDNLTSFIPLDNSIAGKALEFVSGKNCTYTGGAGTEWEFGGTNLFGGHEWEAAGKYGVNCTGNGNTFGGDEGTIMMYVQPEYACSDAGQTYVIFMGDVNDYQLQSQAGVGMQWLITQGGVQQVVRADCSGAWAAGQWIWISVTWDTATDTFRVYNNSNLLFENVSAVVNFDNHQTGRAVYGHSEPDGLSSGGNWSHIMTFDRELTQTEISMVVNQSVSAGSEQEPITNITVTAVSSNNGATINSFNVSTPKGVFETTDGSAETDDIVNGTTYSHIVYAQGFSNYTNATANSSYQANLTPVGLGAELTNLTYGNLYIGNQIQINCDYTDEMGYGVEEMYWIQNVNDTTLVNQSNKNYTINSTDEYDLLNFWCELNNTYYETNTTLTNLSGFLYLIKTNEVRYNATTTETASENFFLNISTAYDILSASSIFNYNGTEYSISGNCNDNNECTFSKDIDINLITSESQNKTFWWNYTIYNGTGTLKNSTTIYQQNVSRLHLEECNATYTTKIMNFSAYEETNFSRVIPYSFEGTFNYWIGNGAIRRSNSISNTSAQVMDICLKPNVTVNFETSILYGDYNTSIYTDRYFSLSNKTASNNSVEEFKMYLLRSTASTTFIQEVLENYNGVEGATIYMYKFNPATNEWVLVQTSITDSDGKSVGFYEAETALYRHEIWKDGVLKLNETSGRKIIPQSVPYKITWYLQANVSSPDSILQNKTDLVQYLTFNNKTEVVSFTYTDLNISFNQSRLIVYFRNWSYADNVICNTTSSLPSATINCNLSGLSEGSYYAQAYIKRFVEEQVNGIGFTLRAGKDTFGTAGLIIGFFLILTAAMAFMFNAIIGILAVNATLILLNLIGIVSFNGTFTFGIIIISAITIYLLKG